jgi:Ion channel
MQESTMKGDNDGQSTTETETESISPARASQGPQSLQIQQSTSGNNMITADSHINGRVNDAQRPKNSVAATDHPLSVSTRKQQPDEDEIDRLAEDLVLVEGDGNVHRPIPLKLKRAIPKQQQTKTKTTTNLSKINSNNIRRLGQAHSSARVGSDGTNSPKPSDMSPQSQRKSGMEDFFDRVRRTSGLHPDDDSDDDYNDSISQNEKVVTSSNNKRSSSTAGIALTSEDIEICQRLDDEYERALEEREIGYNARYASVRQSAFVSVLFLVLYMIQGTLVYMHQTEWSIPDSLFFSIFTITTVGYGMEDLPTTPEFQAYTIFYIMVGIAALTIMVRMIVVQKF